MLMSRIYPLLKVGTNNSQRIIQSVRHSHVYNYRCGPPPPAKSLTLTAEIFQGIAWWWMLWHLWTEPEHLYGEFEYPDPYKWTDEELGIPSD